MSLAVVTSTGFAVEQLPDAEGVPGLRYYAPSTPATPPKTYEADVIIYGASPGGVTAAVQLQRMGKKAIIAEFGNHVGGLTTGGLSATDLGNRNSIAGKASMSSA